MGSIARRVRSSASSISLRRLKSSPRMQRNSSSLANSTRICVSDYSVLLYDLSQRDSAIKSLKNELKSIKLSLKRKDKECQRLIDSCSLNGKSKKRMKNKLSNALLNATSDSLSSSKNGCNTLFDIRSSAVWSARLSHCNIQIAELKKKLAFEQEICSQNDDDMDTYKYENKSLKSQLQSVHKKLEHQIAIKSKKKIKVLTPSGT